MRKILNLLVTGIMLVALVGCGTTNVPTKVTSTTPSTTEQVTKTETFQIGDTFKLGDLQYRVNGVRTSAGTNQYMKPKEGNVFLLIDVTVENQGKDEAGISSMLSFKLSDKEGRSQELSIEALTEANGKLDGSIPPGKKITGELGYQVPTGPQSFELGIKADLLSTGTAVVSIPVK